MTTLIDDMQKLATLGDPLPIRARMLTPETWLAVLPAVIAQLDEAQHEEFVLQILRTLDKANVEMADCALDVYT